MCNSKAIKMEARGEKLKKYLFDLFILMERLFNDLIKAERTGNV